MPWTEGWYGVLMWASLLLLIAGLVGIVRFFANTTENDRRDDSRSLDNGGPNGG